MSDAPINKNIQLVECPADKDPAVRVFIGAAMCLGGAAYCHLTPPDTQPEGPFSMDKINHFAEWYLFFYGRWVFGALGIVLAILGARILRRQITADAEGMTVNRKRRYAWREFTGIDATLLATKGQLTLQRGAGEGVVLRRYQYKNFKALVELIEQSLVVSYDKRQEVIAEHTQIMYDNLFILYVVDKAKYPTIAAKNLRNVPHSGFAINASFSGEQFFYAQ